MALDKLVDSTQLNTDLTAVADAIRAKSGGSAALAFPAGFVSAVEAIETGGGIDIDTFAANGLTGVITIPNTTTIRANAFNGQPLTGVSGSEVTSIGDSAFAYCRSLVNIDFPNLTTITGNYCFRNCDSLGTVHFSKLKTSKDFVFYQCGYGKYTTPTTIVVLPAIETPTTATFLYEWFRQGRFAAIDIGPNVDKIRGTFYAGTYTSVILRRTASIVVAQNADAVSGLSNVWVPSALISEYEQATNWSTRISGGHITLHAIEGSIYENAYADGTPIS